MSPYQRLTQDDRRLISAMESCQVYRYRIAQTVKRSPSAISQEMKRNSSFNGYNHKEAQNLTNQRRAKKSRPVLGDAKVLDFVIEKLKQRRSPKQISVMAKQKNLEVSKSSIYNLFELSPELKKYRKHKKYRRRKKLSSKHGIPDRVSILHRPEEATNRTEYGHFEIDFVIGADNEGSVLSGRDRKTRYPVLIKMENKREETTQNALLEHLLILGAKTISTDNDKSFVCHTTIRDLYGIPSFFTRPGAPQDKGSVEQLNKELRVFFPKKTNFKNVTQKDLDEVVKILRETPMQVLDWKTPQQAFDKEIFCSNTC